MNENCANAYNPGGMDCSQDCIFQESRTDSTTLEFEIDGQTPNHHHRYRVGHIPPDAAWSIPMRNRARAQRVIAHNLPLDADDIASGCAAFLIG